MIQSAEDSQWRIIACDLDGTLIDSIELILSSMRYAFAKLARPCPSDEEWTAGIGIPLFTMLRRYAADDAEHKALIAAYREHQIANHESPRTTKLYDHRTRFHSTRQVYGSRARNRRGPAYTFGSKPAFLSIRPLTSHGTP